MIIRNWLAKFNTSLSERAVSSRHKFKVPVKIMFAPNKDIKNSYAANAELFVSGETKDLSKTGISFIVSTVRIRENYLVGEDRTLNAELDLPNGRIKMQIIGKRHEQFGDIHSSGIEFLIGAKIVNMDKDHREAYEEFLRLGKKMFGDGGKLKLGVDRR